MAHRVETAAFAMGRVLHHSYFRDGQAVHLDQREEVAVSEVPRALREKTARREGRYRDDPGRFVSLFFVAIKS